MKSFRSTGCEFKNNYKKKNKIDIPYNQIRNGVGNTIGPLCLQFKQLSELPWAYFFPMDTNSPFFFFPLLEVEWVLFEQSFLSFLLISSLATAWKLITT